MGSTATSSVESCTKISDKMNGECFLGQRVKCFKIVFVVISNYALPLFRTGQKRDLDETDLTKPLKCHRSTTLGKKMAIAWSNEVDKSTRKKRRPSLTRAIFKVFWADMLIYGIILFMLEILIRLSQPFFIGLTVRYFGQRHHNMAHVGEPLWLWRVLPYNFVKRNQSTIRTEEAYVYGSGIVMVDLISTLSFHPYMMAVLHAGMRIRIACCSLIYRKALRVQLVSLDGNTVGTAVNLMSNDVTRFDMAPLFVHFIWIAPLQAGLCVAFMYMKTGEAALYGMISLVVFIPMQILLGYLSARFRFAAAIRTDERIRSMNEIIEAIQVIKMYAWEKAFVELIHKKRRRETNIILLTGYIKGLIMSSMMFVARLGIFLTLMTYVLGGGDLDPEIAFFIAAFYMIIRQSLTVYFPQGVALTAEASVSIGRIQHFLLLEESVIGDPSILDPKFEERGKHRANSEINRPLQPSDVAQISISRGLAKYGNVACLENVNVDMSPGQLIVVVGPVGAGKTCLLQLILGELRLFSGKITVRGVISYASQEPWLFQGSVRHNILFGRDFEPMRYAQVVKACALTRDFQLFPYGDSTIIGERGASLSGGQRARVNLARAVYKKADIYLLDDPLSAVDIQVGAQLFDECILKYLTNNGKIVVLITHQLQYLPKATKIMILREGVMVLFSDYQTIIKSRSSFASLIEESSGFAPPATREEPADVANTVFRQISMTTALVNSTIDIEGIKKKPRIEEEMRTLGSIDCSNYRKYFFSGANCFFLIIMALLFLGAQCLGSGGDFLVGQWTNVEQCRSENGPVEKYGMWAELSTDAYIDYYMLIITLTVVVAVVRSFYFFTICIRASVKLHHKMFTSVIHGSMQFFNNNNSGRILNRFSMDLGAVDELLPYAFIDSVQLLLNLCGAVVVIGIINQLLLVPIFFMFVCYYFLRKCYLTTSRSVKRLEGIVRSPIYSHLTASLQGLSSIRSNGAELLLVGEFEELQDIHSSAWFMFLYTSRTFGLYCDLISSVFIGAVTISFFIFEEQFTGGDVGLIITQCIGLSGLIQWGLKQSAELENQMTSVERILEFCEIEHEPDLESGPDKKPPPLWPKTGKIEFIKVFMRYSPTAPPVLKNLNFLINSEEKVGIVGRTGAGKSSLILTLFRLSYFEGTVLIDNLDITVLGLHDLRKKLSIIPQEPVLFSGTMRYNLDPFSQYGDEEILKALLTVEIKAAMKHGIDCLDEIVTEGGSNISVGERQMICLARAILRNNTLLVMDEATANVDAMTDKMIQKTIRVKFAKCTVLTIAHRLNTIMDSDRVIVMNAGVPEQFDHPHLLLQNKNGIFYDMVQKTGPMMSQVLNRIAKESYEVRKSSPVKKRGAT